MNRIRGKYQLSLFYKAIQRLSLVSVLLYSNSINAQELWGISNSNYSGQMGVALNPATLVGATYNWELHLFSLDANATNNYMFLKQGSGVIRKSFNEFNFSDTKINNNTTPDYWSYGSSLFKAPAFIYSNKKFGFGFSTSLRTGYSVVNVPSQLANLASEGFVFDSLQRYFIKDGAVKAAAIIWQETAITVGALIIDDGSNYLSFGLTGKNNRGFESAYLNFNQLYFKSSADSLLFVQNINIDYGYSLPVNFSNQTSNILSKRGNGYGLNAGFQYMRNRNESFYNNCSGMDEKPYDFKIGASLIDLGYMTFNRDAKNYRFNNLSTDWFYIDTAKFFDVTQVDSLLSAQFASNLTSGRYVKNYKIATPAAISLQVDWALDNHFFVNVSALQRIVLNNVALRRMNQFALTPRYERKRFEVAIPFSYYEQFKPRIGIGLRYGILTIGSDMLSPLFGLTKSYGADFYFGLSIKSKVKSGGISKKISESSNK